jgi:biotin operon repressor
MAIVSVEIEELIPILRQVGGFESEEELAKAIGISRVTFNA